MKRSRFLAGTAAVTASVAFAAASDLTVGRTNLPPVERLVDLPLLSEAYGKHGLG